MCDGYKLWHYTLGPTVAKWRRGNRGTLPTAPRVCRNCTGGDAGICYSETTAYVIGHKTNDFLCDNLIPLSQI